MFHSQYGGVSMRVAMLYSVKITETRLRKSTNWRKTWKNRGPNVSVVQMVDGTLLPTLSSENVHRLQQKYKKHETRRNQA